MYWARLDKRRPVLVLSPDYRNEHATDVIVVPTTTNLHEAPTHVLLRRREGGLPRTSMLKCEQITTIHRDDVQPVPIGGSISERRLSQVERGVLRAIGVPVGY